MPLTTYAKHNFNVLVKAFRDRQCLLMECQLVATGQPVPVICAVQPHADESHSLIPLAQLFTENPYQLVNPPHFDREGFATQEEVWQTPPQ